jgi:hypothetical protein
MRATRIALCLAGLLPFLFACGEDDFQAGNRLIVESITDEGGASTPIYNAFEKTDDSGKDGDPAVVDPDGSQGDGFPDLGETVLELISDDRAVITLRNEARLGVDPGVDLHLIRIDFTYRDANGATRDFAPKRSVTVSGTIPNDSTEELTVVLIPVEMKLNGLRGIFLFGTPEEIAAVRQWTVIVDVFARDIRNDDIVHAQGRVGVRFINPLVEQVSQ